MAAEMEIEQCLREHQERLREAYRTGEEAYGPLPLGSIVSSGVARFRGPASEAGLRQAVVRECGLPLTEYGRAAALLPAVAAL